MNESAIDKTSINEATINKGTIENVTKDSSEKSANRPRFSEVINEATADHSTSEPTSRRGLSDNTEVSSPSNQTPENTPVSNGISEAYSSIRLSKYDLVPGYHLLCGSRYGGILYLLNFLNRQPTQALIAQHWKSVPIVWSWLLGAIETIEDHQVLKDDPLYHYIVKRASGADHYPAIDDSSSVTGLSADIVYKLQQISETLYPRHLWNAELLALPSDISINLERILVRADLAQANINARIHGLDLNPGWLPWFGYTVQFEFEHGFTPTPVRKEQLLRDSKNE
jgi:hypothetical protein